MGKVRQLGTGNELEPLWDWLRENWWKLPPVRKQAFRNHIVHWQLIGAGAPQSLIRRMYSHSCALYWCEGPLRLMKDDRGYYLICGLCGYDKSHFPHWGAIDVPTPTSITPLKEEGKMSDKTRDAFAAYLAILVAAGEITEDQAIRICQIIKENK